MREVDIANDLAGLVKHLLAPEFDELEVRLEEHEVLWRHSREKLVRAVNRFAGPHHRDAASLPR